MLLGFPIIRVIVFGVDIGVPLFRETTISKCDIPFEVGVWGLGLRVQVLPKSCAGMLCRHVELGMPQEVWWMQ